MNLITVLQQESEAIVSVSCVYLEHHSPGRVEVDITDHDNVIRIKLIEEQLN